VTEPVSIHTREPYFGDSQDEDAAQEEKGALLQQLDVWRQGVEHGHVVGLMGVVIRKDLSVATYFGMGLSYPRVVNVGAMTYLQAAMWKALEVQDVDEE
jgi:hypothetical protein